MLKPLSIALFSATLVLASACDTGPKPGEEAEYFGKQLVENEDAKKKAAALAELTKLKSKKSLPALNGFLKSSSPELKPKIAQLIGLIGDESSVASLVDSIDYKVGAGRDSKGKKLARANERIAKALGGLAKPGDAKAIEALTRLSSSNHLETQLASVVALGDLKAVSAVDDIITIADGHDNNFMVKNAIQSLGKIGDEKAIDVLIKNLFFERKGVSFYAESSYALFEIGKAAIPQLIETFHNKNEKLRKLHLDDNVAKAKTMVVLTDLEAPQAKKLAIQNAGIEVIGPKSAAARAKCHEAIGRLNAKEGIPVLMKFADDVDVSKSEFAVSSLVALGARQAIPKFTGLATRSGFFAKVPKCKSGEIKQAVCDRTEYQVRKPRLDAISRLAGAGDLKAWDAWLKDEKNVKVKKLLTERRPMLEAAKECKTDTACWIKKMEDKNPRVREKAAFELGFSQKKEAVPALLKGIADEDNYARAPAIQAVWWLKPKEGVKVVDEILKREKGKTQFIRINEDLKRLRVALAR